MGGNSFLGKVADPLGFWSEDTSARDAAELEAAANRNAVKEIQRQFNLTQDNIAPNIAAGQEALPGLQQGATVEGLDARLDEIFNSDIFGSLVEERTQAVEGQLAAGGLMRSGAGVEAAAAVPQDIGLALEALLSGRESELVGSGQNAALGLGAIGNQSSGQIADYLGASGRARSAGIVTDAQSEAAKRQGAVTTGATVAAMFFSDIRLKENIEKISDVRGLGIYQWDWRPETDGTLVELCGNIGFMAHEVQDVYPEFVHEFSGIKVINYPALLKELENGDNLQ
ncbi:MAG: tail fiber domain-containing protein [Sneathiella sp.]|uniref:tail fiber domain-containing protein n=1 Tax=Sneathiella sp. TaxID=1964365 RepID=UPI0030015390